MGALSGGQREGWQELERVAEDVGPSVQCGQGFVSCSHTGLGVKLHLAMS